MPTIRHGYIYHIQYMSFILILKLCFLAVTNDVILRVAYNLC